MSGDPAAAKALMAKVAAGAIARGLRSFRDPESANEFQTWFGMLVKSGDLDGKGGGAATVVSPLAALARSPGSARVAEPPAEPRQVDPLEGYLL